MNEAPVIHSIEAERDWVDVSNSITIDCLASDPDGDELKYRWLANGGTISGEGSSITWTAPDNAGSYTVSVVVDDGRGGEVTASLAVDVRLNRPPVIERLSAESTSVRPGEDIAIECVASDPEGDELSYHWSASSGIILGEGSRVTWIAPNAPGTYVITVEVSDGRDTVSSPKLLRLEVRPNEPPIIDSLTAEETTVLLGRSTVIRCEASDPDGDELTYRWTATGGELSGEGAEVTWTALGGCGDRVTISVSVTDGYGGETSEKMTIRVRTPG
jgi:hypothetical protein